MANISGHYHIAGRSEVRPAILILATNGSIRVLAKDSDLAIRHDHMDECREGDVLPGLPIDLIFSDGDRFTPDDVHTRWVEGHSPQGIIRWMESHFTTVIIATILVPFILWALVVKGVPALASVLAPMIPDSVTDTMGQSALSLLDRILDPSELDKETQTHIIQNWESARDAAGLDDHYQVIFRKANNSPNAFALADGTLVVFDSLVSTFDHDYDLVTAVLFHEAGHVDLEHNTELMIQTSVMSVLYTLLLGDMEGLSDTIMGAGLSLTQNAFNRDMESEADDFAHIHLKAAGMQPALLGDALAKFPQSQREASRWEEYWSTHPDTQQRIEKAHNADINIESSNKP